MNRGLGGKKGVLKYLFMNTLDQSPILQRKCLLYLIQMSYLYLVSSLLSSSFISYFFHVSRDRLLFVGHKERIVKVSLGKLFTGLCHQFMNVLTLCVEDTNLMITFDLDYSQTFIVSGYLYQYVKKSGSLPSQDRTGPGCVQTRNIILYAMKFTGEITMSYSSVLVVVR